MYVEHNLRAPFQSVDNEPRPVTQDCVRSARTEVHDGLTRRPSCPLFSSLPTECPESTVIMPDMAGSKGRIPLTHHLVQESRRSGNMAQLPTSLNIGVPSESPSLPKLSCGQSIRSSWTLARYLQSDPDSTEDDMNLIEDGRQDDRRSPDLYSTSIRSADPEESTDERMEEVKHTSHASDERPVISAEDYWLWDNTTQGYYHCDEDTQSIVWYEPLD